MPAKLLRSLPYCVLAFCLTISPHFLGTEARSVDSNLTAHEWGTLASIAGNDGQAVEWVALSHGDAGPLLLVSRELFLSVKLAFAKRRHHPTGSSQPAATSVAAPNKLTVSTQLACGKDPLSVNGKWISSLPM